MTTTTTARRVNYSALSRTARETIRQYPSLSIAGYVRYSYPDGRWHGDRCGCPDRCIGYHHDAGEECGCLPVVLGYYAKACRLGSGWGPVTEPPARRG